MKKIENNFAVTGFIGRDAEMPASPSLLAVLKRMVRKPLARRPS